MVHWKEVLRKNFTQWEPLCDYLELDEAARPHILKKSIFPLNLPYRLASKIKKNSLTDPILLQFVPLSEEEQKIPGYSRDPLQETTFKQSSKLLQKYPSRALLVTTSACAMHCRFCFRRHFDYDVHSKSLDLDLQKTREDPSIKEIILSGGDPLSLNNETLASMITSLETIPHIRRLRIHTRFPIGIPERLDPELLHLLGKSRLQIWVVIHCNHAQELDVDVLSALKSVQKQGIPVLNQAVLLKGVNDSIAAQQSLAETLIDHGILPYYLHQLDKVEGAAHFAVEDHIGVQLIEELQKRISGYGVPKFVREIPQKLSKTPLC
ncbi:MAG: KamA family radical SAM protein [Anaplasmataceae bacterium]|nr:KamA family radical SAM protein [Anaplasmataceae bacterium]